MDILKKLFGHSAPQKETTNVPSTFKELIHLSASYNGYERERALKALMKLQDPTTIPLFIERTNDWVGVIRDIAQSALLTFVESHPQALIENLPTIFHLQKRRRYDHSDFINNIIERLVDHSKQNLIHAITNKDPHLAFIAFKICLTYKLATPYELIAAAISTKHITLARNTMLLIDQVDDKNFEALSEKLLKHTFSPLRNKTIKRLDATNPEIVLTLAETLMTNKDESIRNIGRKYLRLRGQAETEFYQHILDNSRSTQAEKAVALIELTKLIPDKMLGILEAHTKDTSPKIRKVALQQIIKLKGEQAKPILMNALLDGNLSVTKEAARLCYKNDILLTQDELIYLATKKERQHTLDSLLMLAKKNGKWRQLIINLRLLNNYKSEQFVVKRINFELYKCAHACNRGSGLIPTGLVAELNIALEASKSYLNEWHYKTIRFMLDTN